MGRRSVRVSGSGAIAYDPLDYKPVPVAHLTLTSDARTSVPNAWLVRA